MPSYEKPVGIGISENGCMIVLAPSIMHERTMSQIRVRLWFISQLGCDLGARYACRIMVAFCTTLVRIESAVQHPLRNAHLPGVSRKYG